MLVAALLTQAVQAQAAPAEAAVNAGLRAAAERVVAGAVGVQVRSAGTRGASTGSGSA
ncbi:hypothetical protein [Saccharothrix australiensis]|uniref:Uncharacterized protein n=1 Tax=Saccharothrix australiensis TaxID=2072 RepID=A0A495VX50_9PSEU|nr:hypothetical protein [Saccharothrix australiensis]RKT53774.1 hypothetical protein C8E97_2353 [Saccharothrix australiensis]